MHPQCSKQYALSDTNDLRGSQRRILRCAPSTLAIGVFAKRRCRFHQDARFWARQPSRWFGKVCSLYHQGLKDSPADARACCNFGRVEGPMPWSRIISASVCVASSCTVVMPFPCSARLAGATSVLRKSSSGFSSLAQIGHTGQSLLL